METDHEIIVGDCRETLKDLEPDSVDCVITSPPYYGLRDYGVDGQIGRENTLQAYISALVEVFAEVHRVLKPTGTVWLNIGDCYAGTVKGENAKLSNRGDYKLKSDKQRSNSASLIAGSARCPEGLKPKDLMLVPARVAIALQDAGWWVRSEIIWAKPNAMPHSLKDRPINAHEHIWLLTKQGKGYYFDYESVSMPASKSTKIRKLKTHRLLKELTDEDLRKIRSNQSDRKRKYSNIDNNQKDRSYLVHELSFTPGLLGLIKASTYSDVLDDPAIQEHLKIDSIKPETRRLRDYEASPEVWNIAVGAFTGAHFATFPVELVKRCLIAGCPEGGTVLDPFGGAGTVGLVASITGRHSITCELNDEYAQIAYERIEQGGGV